MNQRNHPPEHFQYLANIGMISAGYSQSVKLIRDTFETCDDYNCALDKLANTTIPAITYFILAGIKDNEGAIITRDRMSSVNITYLSNDHWFLVQTN